MRELKKQKLPISALFYIPQTQKENRKFLRFQVLLQILKIQGKEKKAKFALMEDNMSGCID